MPTNTAAPTPPSAPPTPSFWDKLRAELQEKFDRSVPWHSLPTLFGIVKLIELRKELRQKNLFDTGKVDSPDPMLPPPRPARLDERTADGTWNDLNDPHMGSVGMRFGRNVPLEKGKPDLASLLTPNPREISNRLLARKEFVPATTLNLLAAAWIQFETHDWFSHGTPQTKDTIEVPLEKGDDWQAPPMKVGKSAIDPTRPASPKDPLPTHVNHVTHWWDASQVYGSDEETVRSLRSGQLGKLRLDDKGHLPLDPKTGNEMAGFTDNWWVGLSILHKLFLLEHNTVCDQLHSQYPQMSDDELFAKARLVVAALIAKIHTVEWTPAILNMPTLKIAMNANWWGLETEEFHKLFGRVSEDEALSGIPGSHKDDHGTPFSMTEEFTCVYRMHPLIPDQIFFRSTRNDQVTVRDLTFVQGRFTRQLVESIATDDLLYTFGTCNPGALTLHNYPNTLRALPRSDGQTLDLATIDILRDRERGVPRYNELRRLLHMPAARSFDDITDNAEWAKELSDIYGGDVEKVDPMIGMYAEKKPEGFGFSDTAFRVFILMASRRLKSDRFYTDAFNADTYTAFGLKWVQDHTMSDVLLRHFPQLKNALEDVENAFFPWNPVNPDGTLKVNPAADSDNA